MAFTDTITDPVEVYVNSFGAALFDGVIDDVFDAQVVSSLDGGGWLLGPAHLHESCAKHAAATLSIEDALKTRALYLASVVEARTLHMMLLRMWMAPFKGGGGVPNELISKWEVRWCRPVL